MGVLGIGHNLVRRSHDLWLLSLPHPSPCLPLLLPLFWACLNMSFGVFWSSLVILTFFNVFDMLLTGILGFPFFLAKQPFLNVFSRVFWITGVSLMCFHVLFCVFWLSNMICYIILVFFPVFQLFLGFLDMCVPSSSLTFADIHLLQSSLLLFSLLLGVSLGWADHCFL